MAVRFNKNQLAGADRVQQEAEEALDLEFDDPVYDDKQKVILDLLGSRSATDQYPLYIRIFYSLRNWFNNKKIFGMKVKVFLGKFFLTGITAGLAYALIKIIIMEAHALKEAQQIINNASNFD